MGLFRRHRLARQPVHINVTIQGVQSPQTDVELTIGRRLVIPTDLMLTSWRQLFPAERMMVFGGRKSRGSSQITSAIDVTESNPSPIHVRACPERLTKCLIDLERTGAHFAIWMHSHPGEGPKATLPSNIDRRQDEDLRRHYADDMVGIIAVQDGWLRIFGGSTRQDPFAITWLGKGVEVSEEDPYVFKLQLS